MTNKFSISILSSALFSSVAISQIATPFSISDTCNGATVSYTQNFFDDSTTGTGGFTGNGNANFGVDTSCSPDAMFGHDVYWRLASDPANTLFYDDPTLPGDQGGTSAVVAGSSVVTTWPNAANRGLISATWIASVECCGSRCGRMQNNWVLTNLNTLNPINIEFYAYADFDLGGFANNATTPGSTPARHTIVNPGVCQSQSIEFYGDGAPSLGFEISAWPLTADNLNSTYGPFTGLTNTALPFGPDDYTGAMGWALTIPAGGQVSIAYNFGLNCITCNAPASVVSSPDGNGPTMSSTSLGALGCPVDANVAGATPSSSGSMLLGLSASPIPLAAVFPACAGSLAVISPLTSVPVPTNGLGNATLALDAPTDVSFCGITLYFQYGELLLTLPPCPILMSDTLAITFGD